MIIEAAIAFDQPKFGCILLVPSGFSRSKQYLSTDPLHNTTYIFPSNTASPLGKYRIRATPCPHTSRPLHFYISTSSPSPLPHHTPIPRLSSQYSTTMSLCEVLSLLCCWFCDRKDPDEKAFDHNERITRASQIKPMPENQTSELSPIQSSKATKLQQTLEVQRDDGGTSCETGVR